MFFGFFTDSVLELHGKKKDICSLNPHLLPFDYSVSFPLFQFMLFKLNNGRFSIFKVFLSLVFKFVVFKRFLKSEFHYCVILLYNDEVCGFLLLTEYYLNNQIKENEIVRGCSMFELVRNVYTKL
jgi:hypothetical protein